MAVGDPTPKLFHTRRAFLDIVQKRSLKSRNVIHALFHERGVQESFHFQKGEITRYECQGPWFPARHRKTGDGLIY
jgi:hypothetical protein